MDPEMNARTMKASRTIHTTSGELGNVSSSETDLKCGNNLDFFALYFRALICGYGRKLRL